MVNLLRTYVCTCVPICGEGESVGVSMSSYVRTYIHIDHTYCMHTYVQVHACVNSCCFVLQ